jgi:hypothetical protein
MSKDHTENPKVDPRLDYVLKHRDRVAFISCLTPVAHSPKFSEALKLSGNFLSTTCFTWSLFDQAVEYNQAKTLYDAKTKPNTSRVVAQKSVSRMAVSDDHRRLRKSNPRHKTKDSHKRVHRQVHLGKRQPSHSRTHERK